MDEPLSLTLLYTAEIAGDLALLPRLYTFIQRLRPPAGQPALLLDLGGSCAEGVPHCRETGGRSTLIVLDGMGYDAANVAGLIDIDEYDSIAEQVTLALVDEGRDWLYQAAPVSCPAIRFTLRPRGEAARMQVVMRPAESTRVEGNSLFPGAVCAGQVGEAVVDLQGEPHLISACIHQMPPDTPQNPSIAGTVEFVEAEARYFARQAGQTRTI